MNFIQEHDQNSVPLAVGCEQRRHRSVTVVERLAELLGGTYNVKELEMIKLNKEIGQKIETENRTIMMKTTNIFSFVCQNTAKSILFTVA
jgi:hypothetical protein